MKQKRILGYDTARALAIFGMVLVNFKIALGFEGLENHWLATISKPMEGRAAATFVILAGVGITLLTKNKTLLEGKRILQKRALFLLVTGFLFSLVWPADILHFYALYIFLGTFFLSRSNLALWGGTIALMLGFVGFILFFDYEVGWNWETFTYTDFWTLPGMIRHMFFNGFHPFFPWAAFLLLGMWLGRQDIENSQWRKRVLFLSLVVAVLTEWISSYCIQWLLNTPTSLSPEDIRFLFSTEAMPPMPFYIIAAGSTAYALIISCIILNEKFPTICQPFVYTGQLALTFYIAHVLLGLGFLEVIGKFNNPSPDFVGVYTGVFCVLCVFFAYFWRSRYTVGPLEKVMRYLTSR